LAEVGVLETPKLQGKYDTGQVSQLIALLATHVIIWILTWFLNTNVVNFEYSQYSVLFVVYKQQNRQLFAEYRVSKTEINWCVDPVLTVIYGFLISPVVPVSCTISNNTTCLWNIALWNWEWPWSGLPAQHSSRCVSSHIFVNHCN